MPQTPIKTTAPAPHHPAGADPILEERQALLYQYCLLYTSDAADE